MDSSRRDFLITGLAALTAAGCAQTGGSLVPSAIWPSLPGRGTAGSPYIPTDDYPNTPGRDPGNIPSGVGTAANPIGRSTWSTRGPLMSDINPMNGVKCITLHHEGYPQPVTFTDTRTTAGRLDQIRSAHRGRGWADIGYHYVIDRAGRVWEGRDIRYQGAHVSNNNENNLGIMCLGNFELQSPSEVQLTALRDTVRFMRKKYNVSMRLVRTHQEVPGAHTACPGRYLQPRIASMRSNGMFA